ncbi:hypothetical protein Metme_0035 [Methylomonas methanica MC09]|uniref:Uncharacterized protein n=1 Tax=Methylomonas methanica (strain DSM 25384 / MC09) TaxID=857087 RepID=F9ZX28_METMM|nr:hypothetical protein Metme_0035 [Methylomonas methanica MC09]
MRSDKRQQLSSAKLSEKWFIEFKAVFHFLCHTLYSLLTQKMKNSGFCATNNEKIFQLRKLTNELNTMLLAIQ